MAVYKSTCYTLSIVKRFALLLVFLSFMLTSVIGICPAYAKQGLFLPSPGTRVSLSPAINPLILKGIKVHPDHLLQIEFILDKGSETSVNLKQESTKLIKYFLESLTIPEKDMWVNLSPMNNLGDFLGVANDVKNVAGEVHSLDSHVF